MTGSIDDAARRLAAVLAGENAALAALDFAAAIAVLAEKQAALAELTQAKLTPARGLVEQLRTLAGENRRLLAQAILVQQRVLGTIARAAPRALATGSAGYGHTGGAVGARLPAVVLSARW